MLEGVVAQMVLQGGTISTTFDVNLDRVNQKWMDVHLWQPGQPPVPGCLAEIRVIYHGVLVASATYDPACKLP